jgi:inner membrane protein
MACAAQHSTFNFFAVTAATAVVQQRGGRPVDGTSLAMGFAAAALPTLPDYIEPALHPNHRKFFHSIAVVAGLAYAMRRVYVWEAEGEWERLARALLLAGGAAYLGHLALDALSAKSLPLI